MKINEKIAHSRLIKESTLLQRKWGSILTESKFDRAPMNESKKHLVARLIENQQRLNETASAGDVAGLQTVFLSLVRRVYPNLIANDLFGIQALDRPGGIVFYLKAFLTTDKSYLSSPGKTNEIGIFDYDTNQYRYDTSYSDAFATGQATIGSAASGAITISTAPIGNQVYNGNTDGLVGISVFADGREVGTIELKNTSSANSYVYVAGSATGYCIDSGTDVIAAVSSGTLVIDASHKTIALDGIGASVDLVVVKYRTNTPYYGAQGDGTYGNKYDGKWPIPEVEFVFQSQVVGVKSRKLKTGWPLEMDQDMKTYHNENPEDLLTNHMSMQIMLDIDRELIYTGRSVASFVYEYDFKTPMGSALPTGSGLHLQDFNQGVAQAVNWASNEIYRRCLRGRATFGVTNPTLAARLEDLNIFRAAEVKGTNDVSLGIDTVGTLGRAVKIITDPIFPGDEIFLGHKGPSPIDSGLIYAPYMPLTATDTLLDPNDISKKKALMSRYGILLIDKGQNFYGRVRVSSLPETNNTNIVNVNIPGLPVMPMGTVTTPIADVHGVQYAPNTLT